MLMNIIGIFNEELVIIIEDHVRLGQSSPVLWNSKIKFSLLIANNYILFIEREFNPFNFLVLSNSPALSLTFPTFYVG